MAFPPDQVNVAVIGAGVAGAATAAALARAGMGPGVILEREALPGAHASGKNAGMACLTEFDPVLRQLAVASVRALRRMPGAAGSIVSSSGGIYLGQRWEFSRFNACVEALKSDGVRAELLDRVAARDRFEFLAEFGFDLAIYNADEGVIDIHALLLAYLDEARRGGFTLVTRADVLDLEVEQGRAVGVVTSRGRIRAGTVIDAGGAWAGRIGRTQPLPLQPVRRHLFVSDTSGVVPPGAPSVWHLSDRYYLRPEGKGLLLCACDESPQAPGVPPIDPTVVDLLATKLAESAAALADLPIRSSWACLRTFTPDRRPVIGPDPEIAGLFHVSGLGGSGMGTSWAIGEVAAALIGGAPVPFIDAVDVAVERLVPAPGVVR